MPKAWRKCSLCPVDSYKRTDLVIFSTQALASLCTTYVCELHYQPDDMKEHGDSKRYSLHTCKLTWFDLCVHISDLSLGLPRLYLLLPMQTTSTPGMATSFHFISFICNTATNYDFLGVQFMGTHGYKLKIEDFGLLWSCCSLVIPSSKYLHPMAMNAEAPSSRQIEQFVVDVVAVVLCT